MAPSTVDVVIVNWNSGRLVERCAESLAAALEPGPARTAEIATLTVVDNGSDTAELPDLARAPFATALLRNDTNKGFAAACNRGAAAGKGEFVLFLNPDTRVMPDTLAQAARLMAMRPDVGICGVRTVGTDGATLRSCARLPRAAHLWNALLGLDQLAPRMFPGIMLRT